MPYHNKGKRTVRQYNSLRTNSGSGIRASLSDKKSIRYGKFFFLVAVSYAVLLYMPIRIVPDTIPYAYALYDKNGVLLGASVASDGQWRFSPEKAVPDKFAAALIAFEDKRFYYHLGIDPIAVVRALLSNIRAGHIVSGASTLTMQTMRILAGNKKRTLSQKLIESLHAILAEIRLGKAHILSLYAAQAPFGGNVVGLEAASWRYFNRSPASLSWAEAATLAVLPNQPALVYPGARRAILLEKRNALLHTLYQNKAFDAQTLELSLAEPLPRKPYPLPALAPHYLAFLKKKYPQTPKFYTDIDANMQKNLQRILELRSSDLSRKGINNAAAVIIETATGKVCAYCGNTGLDGRNTRTSSVDIVQALRSSGSLLKPFLYAALLDSGKLLPDQLVIDIPTRIGSYKPDNNIPLYRGAVPASEALSRSLNIPAVRMLREYGISRFIDYLKRCGFTTITRSSEEYGLPLILGGGEITLYEVTRSYAELMNAACRRPLFTEYAANDTVVNGSFSKTPSPQNSPAQNHISANRFPVSSSAAWLTLKALAEGERPDDEALWRFFAGSKRIAWKTGTSNGNRDGWAIGTTATYTVGVWFGNAEGQGREDLLSSRTAAPALFEIFSLLPQSHWPHIPLEDVKEETYCAYSGYIAGHHCTRTIKGFRPAKAPQGKLCPYCTAVTFTPDGKFQADVSDMKGPYAGQFPLIQDRFVLPPAIEYYYTRFAANYKKLPPFAAGHTGNEPAHIAILFPEQGARIVIPVELDGSAGALIMQAAARDRGALIYWDMDGTYLGSTRGLHTITIHPKTGTHVLTITDSLGSRQSRTFEVLDSE